MRSVLFLFFTISSLSVLSQKAITLEDIFQKNTFKLNTVGGFTAMKDGERYTQLDEKDGVQYIGIYELKSGKKITDIYDARTFGTTKSFKIADYQFSEDEQKMLFFSEPQSIYRRSVLYYVYLYDKSVGNFSKISDKKVLHATFSPDGRKIAYVQDNNLYVYDINTSKAIAVTTDGEKNKVINGNCDWVYEEEFEFTKAFQWSSDSKTIAYYRFDETHVPEYTLPIYDSLYPHLYTYKYPKAGEQNSVVSIFFYDIGTGKRIATGIGSSDDQYIPRIA